MAQDEVLDLIVVGAGISGLQTLRECLIYRLTVRVLEGDAVPGGKWSGHGIYNCVKIQQHKEDFYLPGSPFPSGVQDFPARDDMLGATHSYIEQYGLRPYIECRSFVQSAMWDEAAGVWTTVTSTGREWKSRYIALALGTLGPPNVPPQVTKALSSFRGAVVHISEYCASTPQDPNPQDLKPSRSNPQDPTLSFAESRSASHCSPRTRHTRLTG